MKIGSEAHKQLFCQSFLESYLEYEPQALAWPNLDQVTLDRLRSIPFWEEALYTERTAGVMVSSFAETIDDPMIKTAIALQGKEETRHGQMLEFLVNHYDIKIGDRQVLPIPDQIEQAFISFGYSECLDSFFAFGLFEIARQSRIFPEAFFTIFDPILDEEARHIVFFVNWVAYLQANRGRGARIFRAAHSLWNYGGALRHLFDIISGTGPQNEGFTATSADSFDLDITPEIFLSTCVQENKRRMSKYDPQLLQPELLPRLATVAQQTLNLWPKKAQAANHRTQLN